MARLPLRLLVAENKDDFAALPTTKAMSRRFSGGKFRSGRSSLLTNPMSVKQNCLEVKNHFTSLCYRTTQAMELARTALTS